MVENIKETKIEKNEESRSPRVQLPFGKINFLMMGGCVLLIIVGFLLMSGGGSATETI